jgi:hypothetical protein
VLISFALRPAKANVSQHQNVLETFMPDALAQAKHRLALKIHKVDPDDLKPIVANPWVFR